MKNIKIITAFLLVTNAHAGLINFTSGTPISASQVNNNFQYLQSQISSGQTFLGSYNANTDIPAAVTTLTHNGDYMVVTVAGSGYAVGDWIMYNGSSLVKLPYSTTTVGSFNGRVGTVTLAPSDYVSFKTAGKITNALLNDFPEIDMSTAPTTGQVLKFNGTHWVPSNESVTLAASSVGAAEISNGVITYAKLNLADGDIPQTKIAGLTSTLSSKENVITAGSPSLFFRGDKTWSPITTDNVSESTNLYFTNARVLGANLTGLSSWINSSITSADSILVAFQKTQGQINNQVSLISNKADTTNITQTITASTVTGLSAPVAGTDAANKTYVDSFGQWSKSGSDIYRTSGFVGIGTNTPTVSLEVNGAAKIGGINIWHGIGGTASNLAIGENTMLSVSSGIQNAALGRNALWMLTTGSDNTAIGDSALSGTTSGGFNTAVGYSSLNHNTTGYQNTAVGNAALNSNLIGALNVAMGDNALFNSTGNYNTALGSLAGYQNTTGGSNIFIGYNAGNHTSFSTYSGNVIIGGYSVTNTGGNNQIIIADGTGAPKIYANTSGNVGIGTMSPTMKLDVAGNVNVTGGVTATANYTVSSDINYKKEIFKIKNALEKITSINGVTYFYKTDEFPEMNFSEKRQLGVIAQTVEKVFPEAVTKNSQGYRTVAYSMLIAPIIESIREIKNWMNSKDEVVDKLKAENDAIKRENEEIKLRLARLEKMLSKK